MSHTRTKRIIAGQPFVDDNSRQVRCVELNPGNLLPGQIVADFNRHETAIAFQVFFYPFLLGFAQGHDFLKSIQRFLNVWRLFGDNQRLKILLIAGDCYPVAVKNNPPRRNQQPGRNPVFVSQRLVAVRLIDLQIIQTGDNYHQQ